MPRISAERREARRREIMEVAWRCFAANGFHATSMDDIIRASGASASGVYRYVSGKDELIAGAGVESSRVLRERLLALSRQEPVPTPADAIRSILAGLHDESTSHFYALAVQAWGEALRNPQIASGVAGFYRELRATLDVLTGRWADAGLLGEGADPSAMSYALTVLVPGMLVNEQLIDAVDADLLARAFAPGRADEGLQGVNADLPR